MDPRTLALDILRRSPGLASNPNAQQMIDVIRSGDSRRGEQIARNLCNTYGVDPEQALLQARNFFHI